MTLVSTDMEDWGLRTWDDLSEGLRIVSGGQVSYLEPSALSAACAPSPAPQMSALGAWWLDLPSGIFIAWGSRPF